MPGPSLDSVRRLWQPNEPVEKEACESYVKPGERVVPKFGSVPMDELLLTVVVSCGSKDSNEGQERRPEHALSCMVTPRPESWIRENTRI